MTLLSAEQDFSERTLAAIHGALRRLLYVAGLRGVDGRYEHWGMLKIHGEAATQSAIRQSHAGALLDVVRTPVQQLDAELRMSEDQVLADAAKAHPERMLPEGTPKAAALHLSSILLALDALARRRQQSTHRVA
jgi:hypothetical protein